MRVLSDGEENDVSELTPDGDRADQAMVTIRSFPFPLVLQANEAEIRLMRSWADACVDGVNGARLADFLDDLEASRTSVSSRPFS